MIGACDKINIFICLLQKQINILSQNNNKFMTYQQPSYLVSQSYAKTFSSHASTCEHSLSLAQFPISFDSPHVVPPVPCVDVSCPEDINSQNQILPNTSIKFFLLSLNSACNALIFFICCRSCIFFVHELLNATSFLIDDVLNQNKT